MPLSEYGEFVSTVLDEWGRRKIDGLLEDGIVLPSAVEAVSPLLSEWGDFVFTDLDEWGRKRIDGLLEDGTVLHLVVEAAPALLSEWADFVFSDLDEWGRRRTDGLLEDGTKVLVLLGVWQQLSLKEVANLQETSSKLVSRICSSTLSIFSACQKTPGIPLLLLEKLGLGLFEKEHFEQQEFDVGTFVYFNIMKPSHEVITFCDRVVIGYIFAEVLGEFIDVLDLFNIFRLKVTNEFLISSSWEELQFEAAHFDVGPSLSILATTSPVETFLLCDDLSRLITKYLLNTTVFCDAIEKVKEIIQSLYETLIASDMLSKLTNFFRNLTENLLLASESFPFTFALMLAFLDLHDLLFKTRKAILTESMNLAFFEKDHFDFFEFDAGLTLVKNVGKHTFETSTLSDLILSAYISWKQLFEPLVSVVSTTFAVNKRLVDAIVSYGEVEAAIYIFQVLEEISTLFSTLSKQSSHIIQNATVLCESILKRMNRVKEESISVLPLLSVYPCKVLEQVTQLADSLTKVIVKSITNGLNLGGWLFKELKRMYTESFNLLASMLEYVIKISEEQLHSFDVWTRISSFYRQFVEALTLESSNLNSLARTLFAELSLADFLSQTRLGLFFTEVLKLTDTLFSVASFSRVFSEGAIFIEKILKSVAHIFFVEEFTFVDSLLTTSKALRTLVESLKLSYVHSFLVSNIRHEKLYLIPLARRMFSFTQAQVLTLYDFLSNSSRKTMHEIYVHCDFLAKIISKEVSHRLNLLEELLKNVSRILSEEPQLQGKLSVLVGLLKNETISFLDLFVRIVMRGIYYVSVPYRSIYQVFLSLHAKYFIRTPHKAVKVNLVSTFVYFVKLLKNKIEAFINEKT